MTEKRYEIVGTDDFFQHIQDNSFKEDKHEGAIYSIYEVVERLNEQHEMIIKLKKENEELIRLMKSEMPNDLFDKLILSLSNAIGECFKEAKND